MESLEFEGEFFGTKHSPKTKRRTRPDRQEGRHIFPLLFSPLAPALPPRLQPPPDYNKLSGVDSRIRHIPSVLASRQQDPGTVFSAAAAGLPGARDLSGPVPMQLFQGTMPPAGSRERPRRPSSFVALAVAARPSRLSSLSHFPLQFLL